MPRRLIQLTWMGPKTYIYEKDNLDNVTQTFTPLKDGWGITSNGTALLASDGSSNLYWLDPDSLKLMSTVQACSLAPLHSFVFASVQSRRRTGLRLASELLPTPLLSHG